MRRPIVSNWTAEDELILREMAAQGKSAQAIGARLRRPAPSIRLRAAKLGIRLETVFESRRRMGLTGKWEPSPQLKDF